MDGKSTPAKSVKISFFIEAEAVSFLRTMHFSVACVARGWTVTEPTTLVSFLMVWRLGCATLRGKGICGIEGQATQLSKTH